jgi:hypothetical protein
MRQIVALFLVVTLVGSSAPGWADSESTAVEIGSAAGSAFGTMIYAPFKATFCILGGISSGLTAIVSPPTAGKVAMATCSGSWTVSPDMIRGRESPKFIGETAPHRTSVIR